MSKRVLIVGAGPGRIGHRHVAGQGRAGSHRLEKQPRVGGRTSAIEGDGYRFDLGPTFFLYPQILEEIFAAVGRDLHREVPMKKLDPQYRLIFGAGGELLCTSDVERMVAEIAKLAPADAPQFRRFMAYNRVKLEKFAPCLQSPFLGWTSLLQARLLAVLPYLKPWKSLHAELAGYFRDPRLQLAFTFQSKYLGMSPFQCPSLFSILSFLEYEHGVWHPIGGCNALTRGMARVATELGATIRLNEPVEEILFEGRRAVGVRTATGELRADAVVVNADFGHAMTTLVPDRLRRRWTDATIARKRFSCSTFMLYLGIEGRCDQLAAPQHLRRAELPAEPRRDREPACAHRRPVVLRREPVPHRRHAWRRPATARSMCWCRSAISIRTLTGARSATATGRWRCGSSPSSA